MTSSSNSSDQALQDYLDSLLGGEPSAEETAPIKIAGAGNVTALSAAARSARTPASRPFAEPIRTLNLRLPLPPIAPVPTVAPVVTKSRAEAAVAVEPKAAAIEANASAIETKIPVEAKAPATETKAPAIETKAPAIEAKAPAIETKLPAIETKLPAIETNAPATVENAPAAPAIIAPAVVESEPSLAQMSEPAPWLENGRPQWAQQPFECLLFRAGGLMLAAPLVELGSIYPLEDDSLTAVFGQSSWFMGLLPLKEYNARAIDTAMVVMPERYRADMRDAYRFMITLFGSDWGLGVDEVVNSVVLDPDNVRWRGQRSKRPWLAGTVIEQMCALLDISQLAWMFHNHDRKRQVADPA